MGKKIYLVGNPNCGKSTIFNQLTGLQQKVSNLAGTTVEIKKGKIKVADENYPLIDLPGTYSIFPKSEEEAIAVNELLKYRDEVAALVYVADAKQLYRNLLYFSQLAQLKIPIILIVNMWDTVGKSPLNYEIAELEKQLQISVIKYSAKKDDKSILQAALAKTIKNKTRTTFFNNPNQSIDEILTAEDAIKSGFTINCYQKINSLFTPKDKNNITNPITAKLDQYLIHPFFGFIIFGIIMFLLFQALFSFAIYPMEWIELFFLNISTQFRAILPENLWLSDLVINGLIPGIGGILVFVPQIAMLYLFLTILEDTGYMSRVSYLLDSMMRKVGLSGKSVIPMVGGFACAIPAMMSARTINNKKDRLITLLITPLMSCSARLPVYTILIALLAVGNGGIVNEKGLIFFALYISGLIMALIMAFIFKKILPSGKDGFFVMEMPHYRLPVLSNVLLNSWNKTLDFIKGAGSVILIVAIVLWFLSSFGPPSKMGIVNKQYQTAVSRSNLTQADRDSLTQEKNAALIENSFAGHLGKAISPVIKPLGYDWKIGIAIITSFAAREVFVGTLSTIYAVENQGEGRIVERMQEAKRPDGSLVYTKATIISLLVFYMFALQCFSTIAVMKKETGGWKWPIIQFAYLGILAFGGAWLAYQLFS